jgi:hypothetical protein
MRHMRITTYTYPWDLARLGVEPTLRRMADDGVQTVDLAAAYHPIDALSPRNGVSLFSDGRGAVYFPARAERDGRIKPKLHSPSVCAVWPEAARHTATLGLGLNAWTVTLFQPWIRDAHPDTARVLPSGDASGSEVCPANEDVREYVATLCEDAVEQFGVGLVRLEGVMPNMYDLAWLRPRVLVDVPPFARTLLNLCFCKACTSKAAATGLDVERLRSVVNKAVDAEVNGGSAEAAAARAAELSADATLKAFAASHVQSAIDLVHAVRGRIGRRARISTNASTPYGGLLGAETEDGLMTQFIDAADQIAMHPANPNGNRRVVALKSRATPPRELSMLFARIKAPGPAGAAHPGEGGGSQMEQDLKETAARGVDEITLYTYGLLRDRDVSEFVAAVRGAFPAAAPAS